jgi:hypothetical protein
MKSDWPWILVFVLFIAGTYVAEALHSQRKRIESLEDRLGKLEGKDK